MFSETIDCQPLFTIALKGIREQINYLCCAGDLQEYSVLMFINTAQTNDDAHHQDSIYVHRAMNNMNADWVREIDGWIASDNIRDTMYDIVGGSGSCNYIDVFFILKKLFKESGRGAFHRMSVFLFTSNVVQNAIDDNAIKNNVEDLKKMGAEFGVILVNPSEDDEISGFWYELDHSLIKANTLESLVERINIKRKRLSRRSTASIPLRLGNGLELSVGVFYLVAEQKKSAPIMLDAETNELVQCFTTYTKDEKVKGEVDQEDEELYEGDFFFAKTVGDVKVKMDREEYENLRRIDTPGMVIIGFKPMSCLKISHRMGPSQYVFPQDDRIERSSKLYKALFKKCLERDLFILVRYTLKTNTTPKLAALVPQRGEQTEDSEAGEGVSYEGFHLVTLPFSEDKRDLSERMTPPTEEGWPEASTVQVDAAKAFIKKLRTNYNPYQYFNPALQKHYRYVEALALGHDTEEVDKVGDQIKPYFTDDTQAERVHKELDYFKKTCLADIASGSKPKKRGAAKKEDDDIEENKSKRGRKKT
uniref:Ku domain-containing protein n=1 Tax=Acrobeloides nanus TaxID=290746 RepID=A0A914C2R6_9BILA